MTKNVEGIYLFFGGDLSETAFGENRKIVSQRDCFIRNGFKCDFVNYKMKNDTLIDRVIFRLPLTNINPRWKYIREFDSCKFIYFRRPYMMTYWMYTTLLKAKKRNPKLVIIMEIPTYPYDDEIIYRKKMKWLNYPILLKDKFWRNKIKIVVDYIVVPGDGIHNRHERIWDIPVLNIRNGIPLDDYNVKKASDSNDINLIAVANFKEWHGYERVIKALREYYNEQQETQVFLHMVGGGTEVDEYKNLVKKLGLFDKVIFYGRKTPEELNEIYDKCDVGLCSFGAYKKGMTTSLELKSREYLAKGMPIVTGIPIDVFNDGLKYCLEFPNDPSDISINKIINFYTNLCNGRSKTELISDIRLFAEEKIGIDESMKEVTDLLKNIGEWL